MLCNLLTFSYFLWSVHDIRSVVSLGPYTMGGADIRILDAPKDELRAWWNLLSPTNRKLVQGHIGWLLPLLEVKVRTGLVRALSHFWCPEM